MEEPTTAPTTAPVWMPTRTVRATPSRRATCLNTSTIEYANTAARYGWSGQGEGPPTMNLQQSPARYPPSPSPPLSLSSPLSAQLHPRSTPINTPPTLNPSSSALSPILSPSPDPTAWIHERAPNPATCTLILERVQTDR
eukprot:919658-Rhodomonas_salina.3